jgi:ADP-ribose pyrophosphatase YjhB (NUDIX family)
MKTIIASGPVIIEEGKLLVDKDNKDNFYKLPGGTSKEGKSLSETCERRTKEEINANIKTREPLNPMILWENPQTKEPSQIILIHYKSELLNKDEIKPISPIQEINWLDIEEIKKGLHEVAPNIKFLIEKGDIK